MDEQFEISDIISSIGLGEQVHLLYAAIELDGMVKVIVDTEEGIDVRELSRIAKKIRNDDRLAKKLGSDRYRMEVTSPGADAELTVRWQFTKHVGRHLKVYFGDTVDQKPLIGDLREVTAEGLTLALDEGEQVVAWDQIDYAKIKLKW